MPLPDEGPCEAWCTWAQVTACDPDNELGGVDEAVQADVIAAASEALYNLSERRYPGRCTTTRSVCWRCGCRRSACDCRRDVLTLVPNPVDSVTEVVVDGVALDPADWRVDEYRDLVRLGVEPWPRCVDLTDPEAFQVTWVFGRPIPIGGQLGAAALAGELARPCVGSACRIPKYVTVVQREGATYTFPNKQAMEWDGRTGLPVADSWLDTLGAGLTAGGSDPAGPCADFIRTDTDKPVS